MRLAQAFANLTQIIEMIKESFNYFKLGFRAAAGKKFPLVCELIEGLIANLASLTTTIFPKVIWFFYGVHYYRLTAYVEKNWKINDRF